MTGEVHSERLKLFQTIPPLPINKQPSAGHLTSACFFALRWKDYRPPYKKVKLMKPNKTAKNIYFCFHTPASLSILTAYAASSWDNLKRNHFLRQILWYSVWAVFPRRSTFISKWEDEHCHLRAFIGGFKICFTFLLKEILSSRVITDWWLWPSSHSSNSF